MAEVLLAGAYDKYGPWLTGSAESLLDLAGHIRVGTVRPLTLLATVVAAGSGTTGWWTSTAPVTKVNQLLVDTQPRGDGLVDIQPSGDTLTISGSLDSLSYLADSIENLALAEVLTGGVDRHIDFVYYPDHRWLSVASTELTVYLVVPERLISSDRIE